MSEVQPYESATPSRFDRSATRATLRSRSAAQARMARIADEADVSMEKVEQVTVTVANGMFAVARVDNVLRQLEAQSPAISGRLARLADFHEMAVAQTVEDLRRDLRRR